MSQYRLRYFCEYGGPCLWSDNDAARERFGYCVKLNELPLSAETVRKAGEVGGWYSESLNWKYPPHPGPWRQAECDRFNRATTELLAVIRQELGDGFEVVDEQRPLTEDVDLDAYLADPHGFHR